MHVLILDNYDSFTYNLSYILKELKMEVSIFRNDKITIEEIDIFDKILLSPGPGIPIEAGILLELVTKYAPTKSILGVCLGQQAIAEVFGATLDNLTEVHHGVESNIQILKEDLLFTDIEKTFVAGRYHSWVVSKKDFPQDLEILAMDEKESEIMAIRHKQYNLRGVQFHPESILTPRGKQIIKNWLMI
ncbi:MAG: anthranilate synthase component II [Chitinophagaceae bacterium]